MNIINNSNNKIINKINGDVSVALRWTTSADGPCSQGSTETLLQYAMRPSINHTQMNVFMMLRQDLGFLQYSKNCVS